jgi:predicted SprT family Zn-dependent metalloprotease
MDVMRMMLTGIYYLIQLVFDKDHFEKLLKSVDNVWTQINARNNAVSNTKTYNYHCKFGKLYRKFQKD